MTERTVTLLADGVDGHHRGVGTCRGCGQRILWCHTAPAHRPIPFDDLELSGSQSDDGSIETVSADSVHRRTCPAANQFRR